MILCGIDIETSGLKPEESYITEIAWIIKDTNDPKPLATKTYFVKNETDVEISPEITQLTKITARHLSYGLDLSTILRKFSADCMVFEVDYLVGHNALAFDKPFLKHHGSVVGMPLPNRTWIDTKIDVKYPWDCKNNALIYLAAYHGFVNPFPHAALYDVMTMLKVLGHYDIDEIAARADSPLVTMQALVNYDNRELAKKAGFSWENLGNKHYPKCWVKQFREYDLKKMEPFPFNTYELTREA